MSVPEEFELYEFEVYFFQQNPRSRDAALAMRKEMAELIKAKHFDRLLPGRVYEAPEGPHSMARWNAICPKGELARAIAWLMQAHGSLSVLVRPQTQTLKDFTVTSPRGDRSDSRSPLATLAGASAPPSGPTSPRSQLSLSLQNVNQARDAVNQAQQEAAAYELQVEVRTADIFAQGMAILNSANNWLKMGTGIAGAIKERAGPAIQDDCNKIIEKNGGKPLAIGSAIATPPHDLANRGVRYIIHAIANGYADARDPRTRILATEDTVYNAVTSALDTAEKLGLDKLAMPYPICVKHCNLPPARAYEAMCQAMLKAIKAYRPRKLRRVLLVKQPEQP